MCFKASHFFHQEKMKFNGWEYEQQNLLFFCCYSKYRLSRLWGNSRNSIALYSINFGGYMKVLCGSSFLLEN